MSANQLRDTPGRLLLGWAVLFSALVVLAWRIHLHPADYEWTEYPTALVNNGVCHAVAGRMIVTSRI
ncbi:MAG: hypothetical protein U1F81_14610 [Verrucomicrobiaceae bacterium]